MTFKQRLEHGQKLIFTQDLQQSVKILELPLMELKETVETELINNPVIEEERKTEEPSSVSPEENQAEPKISEFDASSTFEKESQPAEEANYEKPVPGRRENLTEVLLKQLRINAADEDELRLGSVLIQNIDENGYFKADLPLICAELDASLQAAEKALSLIQTFDPPGVGARDLKECLLIQLQRKGEEDSLGTKLISQMLENLANPDEKKICRKFNCSPQELHQALSHIRTLEPKPGRRYDQDEIAYVIPDISIEEKDDTLLVVTNNSYIPLIRISPIYRNMLRSKKTDDATKNFIREKIKAANGLINAIRQRQSTITKVVTIIAQTQKKALLEGLENLKPLSIKEIALATELHESTISRVVMNKHVSTPIGILPLRNFFSNRLTNSNGEGVSSQSIKLKIQELIEAEDKKKPLRDQAIAEVLKETQHLSLARRTVAKYREALGIPPTSKRRLKSF